MATADGTQTGDSNDDVTPWYRDRTGRAVVGTYAGLTVLVIVLTATEYIASAPFVADGGDVVPVPGFVYLYAFLGAMAYAFTSLIVTDEEGDAKETDDVVRLGLRILAAFPLAAGVYVLAPAFGIERTVDGMVAAGAFLAGLYVNLTLKALGGIATRLLGRTPEPSALQGYDPTVGGRRDVDRREGGDEERGRDPDGRESDADERDGDGGDADDGDADGVTVTHR